MRAPLFQRWARKVHGAAAGVMAALALALPAGAATTAAPADAPLGAYGPVVVRARVLDRHGRAVSAFSYCWTLRTSPADRATGSLLPPYYVGLYAQCLPLGIAGAYLRSAPAFVATASALDAGPDEAPPFDAWCARPDGLPPISHDAVTPGEAAFIVGEVLRAEGVAGPPPAGLGGVTGHGL